MLTSICDNCKNDNAIYTFYKGKKDGDILIGDSEYLAVCRNCYDKLTKEYQNKMDMQVHVHFILSFLLNTIYVQK